MSATQAMLSEQFIDVMGPNQQEIDQRLDQSEEAFALGKGISESVARQHRHNFISELIAR